MPKRLTKAAKRNFEIRESFKDLCVGILKGDLLVKPRDQIDATDMEHFEAGRKLGNAMRIYREITAEKTEVKP
jgi:hypothetical protein